VRELACYSPPEHERVSAAQARERIQQTIDDSDEANKEGHDGGGAGGGGAGGGEEQKGGAGVRARHRVRGFVSRALTFSRSARQRTWVWPSTTARCC
jgi:hypothetical protein